MFRNRHRNGSAEAGSEPEGPGAPDTLPDADGDRGSVPRWLRGRRGAKPVVELDPQRQALVVPPPPEGCSVLDERVVRADLCRTRLLFDEARGVLRYEILEPQLDGFEVEALGFLREALRRSLPLREEDAQEPDLEKFLEARVDELLHEHLVRIDAVSRARILYYLNRDFVGYGPIDALMRDPDIEDISCDGPAVPIFLFHRRHEAVRTTLDFRAARELDAFVQLLAQRSGRHVSIARPLLDATLPDKSRLQCSFGNEVTPRGSSFTIRRFRADPITPPTLIESNTLSADLAAYLWLAMEHGQSTLIVGGTASGKTTTLNACSLFIPSERKVVTIEDTRELNLPHDNWISGVTRGGGDLIGDKAAGEVSMYDLLAAALRQRPEFLIVGEVRGPEAMTLFQAMATGHATYSTMHADSVPSAVHRLEHPPISVPRIMLENLRIVAIQAQVRVGGKLVRRVREVTEVKGLDPATGEFLTSTVFRWDPAKDRFERSARSIVVERIAARLQRSPQEVWEEVDRRAAVLRWLLEGKVTSLRDVALWVQRYQRDPAAVLAAAMPEGAPIVAPGAVSP